MDAKTTLEQTRREIEQLALQIQARRTQCRDLQAETDYFQQFAGSLMESNLKSLPK